MASEQACSAALKMLSRAFAGVVDPERVKVYAAALEDLTDAELARAAVLVIKTHTGEFIPPPAVLRKAIAPAPVAVDWVGIIRRIEQLATYNPNVGMIYPTVDRVRSPLGDSVAYAYAIAGGPKLFSDDETTRNIAAREFSKALADASSRPNAALPVIDDKSLPQGGERFAELVNKAAGALSADPRERKHLTTGETAA